MSSVPGPGQIYDFGGDGPLVHLAPANGFPPATYRQLVAALHECFHVLSLWPRPLWPGSDPRSAPTWRVLADDLLAGLDGLGLRGIVGVGHSIGGVLTLMAAVRRPDLFERVVLLDPVLLPPRWLAWLRLARWAGLGGRQPLVQAALRRRRTWPGAQACFDHWRSRQLFARWPDSAVWDYVRAGTRPRADGQVELVYPPEWEAHVFATVPTDVWRDVPCLRTPALVLRGEHSTTFRPQAAARVARLLPQARVETMGRGSHLFPLERPEETAEAMRAWLG